MGNLENSCDSVAMTSDADLSDYSKLPAQPLVSVCMITYQHARFIGQALDSVLMQKVGFPYEICLGEDGSTDGTREICIEYARNFPDKVRLFLRNRSNPARKLYKSKGRHNTVSTFDACRGKYIALLEGDDYWLHPLKLQSQVDLLEANSNIAASCHYAAAMQEGKPWLAKIIPNVPVDTVRAKDMLKRDVADLHTSTWMLRRGKPMPWHEFRSSFFGDYPLMIWTLLQGEAKVLPGIWSLYRNHPHGVFSPMSPESRWCENVELWKTLSCVVPQELCAAHSIGMSRTLTMYIGSLIRAGKYRPAFAHLRKNLALIARIPCPLREKNLLRVLAIEAILFPQLEGLRRRLKERRIRRAGC